MPVAVRREFFGPSASRSIPLRCSFTASDHIHCDLQYAPWNLDSCSGYTLCKLDPLTSRHRFIAGNASAQYVSNVGVRVGGHCNRRFVPSL